MHQTVFYIIMIYCYVQDPFGYYIHASLHLGQSCVMLFSDLYIQIGTVSWHKQKISRRHKHVPLTMDKKTTVHRDENFAMEW